MCVTFNNFKSKRNCYDAEHDEVDGTSVRNIWRTKPSALLCAAETSFEQNKDGAVMMGCRF